MGNVPKRVTLKIIAEKAGTSIGTVDRALNNRDGISPESRSAVLKVAQELGYRPNKFASALGRKKAIRVGVACPLEPQEFYRDIDLGIDKAAEELADYGVSIEKIHYLLKDPALARQALDSIDPRLYDGLVINAFGPSSATQIDRFMQMGTPVITFNNDVAESSRLFYVGNNSRQSGQMGGEVLGMLLRGKGDVTVLGNFAHAASFIERFGGFCEFIHPNFPDIRVLPCSECRSDPEVAAQSLVDLLELTPDIKGVFCTGHACTVGAVNALKLLDRKDIYLVGYDVSPKTIAAMREDWCSALLYQNPYQQGYQAVQQMALHLLEGWLPRGKHMHVETHIIIKSNLDSYTRDDRSIDFISKY